MSYFQVTCWNSAQKRGRKDALLAWPERWPRLACSRNAGRDACALVCPLEGPRTCVTMKHLPIIKGASYSGCWAGCHPSSVSGWLADWSPPVWGFTIFRTSQIASCNSSSQPFHRTCSTRGNPVFSSPQTCSVAVRSWLSIAAHCLEPL